MAYSDLLKDPRWQKKRLEVMQRDKFCCQHCESDKKTLNVHHKYYKKGNKPWEYDLSSLITLCESCHKSEEEALIENFSSLRDFLRSENFMADDINALEWFLKNNKTRLFELIEHERFHSVSVPPNASMSSSTIRIISEDDPF